MHIVSALNHIYILEVSKKLYFPRISRPSLNLLLPTFSCFPGLPLDVVTSVLTKLWNSSGHSSLLSTSFPERIVSTLYSTFSLSSRLSAFGLIYPLSCCFKDVFSRLHLSPLDGLFLAIELNIRLKKTSLEIASPFFIWFNFEVFFNYSSSQAPWDMSFRKWNYSSFFRINKKKLLSFLLFDIGKTPL